MHATAIAAGIEILEVGEQAAFGDEPGDLAIVQIGIGGVRDGDEDDIVSGVVACLDNPPADDGAEKAGGSFKPHALYNIGNHRSEPLMKVIEILERECGRKAEMEMLPMQDGDVQRTFADIDAIQSDLGYQPSTTIESGVPEFVRWYREYHGL